MDLFAARFSKQSDQERHHSSRGNLIRCPACAGLEFEVEAFDQGRSEVVCLNCALVSTFAGPVRSRMALQLDPAYIFLALSVAGIGTVTYNLITNATLQAAGPLVFSLLLGFGFFLIAMFAVAHRIGISPGRTAEAAFLGLLLVVVPVVASPYLDPLLLLFALVVVFSFGLIFLGVRAGQRVLPDETDFWRILAVAGSQSVAFGGVVALRSGLAAGADAAGQWLVAVAALAMGAALGGVAGGLLGEVAQSGGRPPQIDEGAVPETESAGGNTAV